jgi:hypothetical protein
MINTFLDFLSNLEMIHPQHYIFNIQEEQLVTVAERSKACTVFTRSEAGTVGSNPTKGMDV